MISSPVSISSKCRRRVHPQNQRLDTPRISPFVRYGAFKVKTVTGFELILLSPKRDFHYALQHVEKLLANVGVRFATAGIGRDAEQMRFHNRVAPGKQFHANAGAGIKNLARARPDEMLVGRGGIVKIENIGFVVTREFTQCADGRAHLRPLKGAEESNRDPD